MKLARTDKDDVAGFYNSGLGINRNDAAAFFYYNDLHVVMPVKRNLCEVQRDGAQIGIVWKLDAQTVYTFIDWNGDFSDSEYPEEYTTTDVQEFKKYIETYENATPGMPFFFQIEDDVIRLVLEKPFA